MMRDAARAAEATEAAEVAEAVVVVTMPVAPARKALGTTDSTRMATMPKAMRREPRASADHAVDPVERPDLEMKSTSTMARDSTRAAMTRDSQEAMETDQGLVAEDVAVLVAEAAWTVNNAVDVVDMAAMAKTALPVNVATMAKTALLVMAISTQAVAAVVATVATEVANTVEAEEVRVQPQASELNLTFQE